MWRLKVGASGFWLHLTTASRLKTIKKQEKCYWICKESAIDYQGTRLSQAIRGLLSSETEEVAADWALFKAAASLKTATEWASLKSYQPKWCIVGHSYQTDHTHSSFVLVGWWCASWGGWLWLSGAQCARTSTPVGGEGVFTAARSHSSSRATASREDHASLACCNQVVGKEVTRVRGKDQVRAREGARSQDMVVGAVRVAGWRCWSLDGSTHRFC